MQDVPIPISSVKDLRGNMHLEGLSFLAGMMVAAAASPPRGKGSKNGICGKSAAAGQGCLCVGQHPEVLR